jgi:hypothetical protein
MQLKTPGSLRGSLFAASCALLGTAAQAQDAPWQVDTGVLYYKEGSGRVEAVEPVVNVRKDFGDEHLLDATLTFDSLTGGSPNGALPSKSAQTFATPSGTSLVASNGVPRIYTSPSGRTTVEVEKNRLYTVPAGGLPLSSFKDQRFAGSLGWSQPFGQSSHFSVGGAISTEMDFNSASLSATVSRDFFAKNTTLSAGVSGEYDQLKPQGGTPVGGSDYDQLLKGGNETKNVVGLQVGLTQVLTRRWIAQLNYNYDRSSGYLTDPYKIVSVVDATGGVTGYRFENRPGNRTRQSLWFGNRVAIANATLDLSYRHGLDDWGSASNAVDARLRIPFGDGLYVEPHARWYRQDAADFYHLYLNGAQALPEFASADQRLAAFTGTTFGVKVGMQLRHHGELSFRLEQYRQTAADRSSSLAQLQGLDLNPGLKSVIAQVGWKFQY